jgi:hypothetical protein
MSIHEITYNAMFPHFQLFYPFFHGKIDRLFKVAPPRCQFEVQHPALSTGRFWGHILTSGFT